jgi:hypothetical protein
MTDDPPQQNQRRYQGPAPAPPERQEAWTKEELERGDRFRQRIASAKAGNARRAAIAARRETEQP